MSDVRARLAEALREHRHDFNPSGHINGTVPGNGTHDCWCDEIFATSDEHANHLADVILSLPGVTTIALPEPTSTREDDEDDESAHRLGWWQNGSPYYITQWGYPNEVQIAYDGEALEPIDVNEARFLAAALLAAADAAEAANNG